MKGLKENEEYGTGNKETVFVIMSQKIQLNFLLSLDGSRIWSGEFGYLVEISQEIVEEDIAWFLFAAHGKMRKNRWKIVKGAVM